MMGVITRSGRGSDDWEMDFEELEMAEQLGVGGYAYFLRIVRRYFP